MGMEPPQLPTQAGCLGALWAGQGEHGQQTELGMCSEQQSQGAAQPWMFGC